MERYHTSFNVALPRFPFLPLSPTILFPFLLFFLFLPIRNLKFNIFELSVEHLGQHLKLSFSLGDSADLGPISIIPSSYPKSLLFPMLFRYQIFSI